MATIYLDFGPTWTLSASEGWAAHRQPPGALVIHHLPAPVAPGAGARASATVPVYNAPVRKVLRFAFGAACEGAGAKGLKASVMVNGSVVWESSLASSGLQHCEVALTDPMGGAISVEFGVEAPEGVPATGQISAVWSKVRLELLAYGETLPSWEPDRA